MDIVGKITEALYSALSCGDTQALSRCAGMIERGAVGASPLTKIAEILREAQNGGAELLRAAGAVSSLSCAAMRPCAAPGGEILPDRTETARKNVSYRALMPLVAALKSGNDQGIIAESLEDSTAFSPTLIPLWEDALCNEKLAPFAVRALAPLGAGYLKRLAITAVSSGRVAPAILDLANESLGPEAQTFLRAVAQDGASVPLRAGAIDRLARLYPGKSCAEFIAGFLRGGRKLRRAALSALEDMETGAADEILAREGERLLAVFDFRGLAAVTGILCRRVGICTQKGESPSSAAYSFFSRILPDLICRPGDHSWIVYECVEAVALFDTDVSTAFLEQMLVLAEHHEQKELLS